MQTEEQQMLNISWNLLFTFLGISMAVTSAIVGASMAYLTLFINNKLYANKEQILNRIDEKFALKATMETRFNAMETEIRDLKNMGKFAPHE